MQTHKIRLSVLYIILNNAWNLMLENSNWIFFHLKVVEVYCHNFKALCQSQISSRNSTHLLSCIRFNCFFSIYRRVSRTLKFHICWQMDTSNVLNTHSGETQNRGGGGRWIFLESSNISNIESRKNKHKNEIKPHEQRFLKHNYIHTHIYNH